MILLELFDRTIASQAGFEIYGEPIVGGQSQVFRAYHAATESTVALKIYPKIQNREHVLREAAALATLRHPNIAGFVSAGYFNSLPYVASPWIEGQRLSEYLLEQGQLSIEHAVKLAREIAAGLGAVHQLKLAHGDISPANILIEPNGKPVIIDFGLGCANNQSSKTEDLSLAGTIRYIAPEIIRGESPTPASDQYSLGVLMYEILAGCWPYESTGNGLPPQAASALHHHLYTEIDPLVEQRPEVNAMLDAVICKTLEKDPDKRYDNLIDFDKALQHSLLPVPHRLNPSPLGRLFRKNKWNHNKKEPEQSPQKIRLSRLTTVKTTVMVFFVSCALAGASAIFGFADTKGYFVLLKSTPALHDNMISETHSVFSTVGASAGNVIAVANDRTCNRMPNPFFDMPLSDNFYKDAESPDMVKIINVAERESSPLLKIGEVNKYGLYGQIIPIDSNNQYIFSALAYPSEDVEQAALTVSWLDQHWQIIKNEDRTMRIEDAQGLVVFDNISAPAHAQYAVPSVFKNASRGTLVVDNLIFTDNENICL